MQTLHPKEEQHASPGGHLFSQVCSPDVIKIGAAHPQSDAALVSQLCGCWGMGVRRVEQLCCFGADGTDDVSLSERGNSNQRNMENVEERKKSLYVIWS